MSSNTQATLKPSGSGPAPTFVVPNLRGGAPISLAAYRGRPVIVSFWASWCSDCRQEMPALETFSRAHPRVAVLGIATLDEDGASRAFATSVGATYPLGTNADGTLLARYGGVALPVTAFVGSRGQLISTVNGQVTAADLARIAPELGT
jgi:cytochrome c biogenesis protein CcmG, thiol:disulfide interchange protein DsbE